MPDGVVSFSTGDFVRNDGTRIEGRGVRPDIMVEYTRGDLIRGEDPDVAQAVDFLSDFEPRDPGRLPSK
jgi:C-terminal processing protease CtpA/Prc